ncbi:hypothetical protein FACS189472_05970 [Alphaproteobacteria bacterium]|nr:hypothetical protein FACS189472_05970 [Alphaproteobacteria bacterium]
MTIDTALLKRKTLALFNFVSMKHQNDKHIGDLTIGDFLEICEFLAELDNENSEAEDASN